MGAQCCTEQEDHNNEYADHFQLQPNKERTFPQPPPKKRTKLSGAQPDGPINQPEITFAPSNPEARKEVTNFKKNETISTAPVQAKVTIDQGSIYKLTTFRTTDPFNKPIIAFTDSGFIFKSNVYKE